MSNSKHSRAPWTYEVHQLSEGFSAIVYDATGTRVGTDHLSEADAALIAAAPDLLAGGKLVMGYFDTMLRDAGYGHASVLRKYSEPLRAAIAKAEGRS